MGVLIFGFAALHPGSSGIAIPQGSEDLVQCEPTMIPVEELLLVGEPGCDLIGSGIRFPDGNEFGILEVGTSSSFGIGRDGIEFEYIVLNWGIPGVSVEYRNRSATGGLWATTPEAERLHRRLQ